MSFGAFPILESSEAQDMVYFGSFPQGIPLSNQPLMAWLTPAQQAVIPIVSLQPEETCDGGEDSPLLVTPLGYQNNILAASTPRRIRRTARMSVRPYGMIVIALPISNSFSVLADNDDEGGQVLYAWTTTIQEEAKVLDRFQSKTPTAIVRRIARTIRERALNKARSKKTKAPMMTSPTCPIQKVVRSFSQP